MLHSRTTLLSFAVGCAGLMACGAMAGDHYVSLNGTNDIAGKFAAWAGAATDIQWAVNSATNGETVWVSNGTYSLTTQVYITNGITLKSFSGNWASTVINGNNYAGKPVTNRCFYLNHANALVDGFTITNGYTLTNGGGVYLNAGTLRNCLVTGNTAGTNFGGGVYAAGAGSLITNCDIIGNVAEQQGGGAYLNSAQLWNSRINYNVVTRLGDTVNVRGGGVWMISGVMQNCIVISNTLPYVNCTYGGGVCVMASTLRNCLIMGNSGFIGGAFLWYGNGMDNCTVVSNYGYYSGITLSGSGQPLKNTISCFNSKNDIVDSSVANYFTNCCFNIVWDVETRVYPPWRGSGNIGTNNPGFANYAGYNYRLAPGSPCLNAGLNQAWMNNSAGLDGNLRIDRFSRRVDIGCYEYLPRGMMFKMY